MPTGEPTDPPGAESADVPTAEDPPITYAEFGERFFFHAVSEERILGAARGLAGEQFEFGPIGVGPGRIAQVSATGEIGDPAVAAVDHELVCFRLTIPVGLDFEVDLGVDRHRYAASVEIGLSLRAHAYPPLRVVIEVEPPGRDDVEVQVEAEALRSKVLKRVAGIERELGRFAAKYVTRELEKEHIRSARDIDVAARIDRAWRA